jgi:hypothetical protein
MAPIIKKRKQPKGYRPVDTDGKLYRVRDKDHGDGSVRIWAENLTYDAAHALKEKVVGAKKSRTARIEEMSIALPSADDTVEQARQKGLAVGRVAAASAQARANQLAARRRQEANASSAPKAKRPAPALAAVPKPVAMELDPDLETPDVPEESEFGEADELGEVEAGVESDINEYEAKGQELYEAYSIVKGSGGVAPKPWHALSAKEQAAFSFEAAADQGPHVDAVRAAVEIQSAPVPIPDGNGVTAGDTTTS